MEGTGREVGGELQGLVGWLSDVHCQVGFDIERGQVVLSEGLGPGTAGVADGDAGGWVPRQILIRCNYCNKPVSADGASVPAEVTGGVQQKGRVCFVCSTGLLLTLMGDLAAYSVPPLQSLAAKMFDLFDDAQHRPRCNPRGGVAAFTIQRCVRSYVLPCLYQAQQGTVI